MAEFVWKKENWFNKFLFCIGWASVLNLIFWIVVLITRFSSSNEKKFWNGKTYYVVYIFGWINLVLAILYIFGIF